ncbi:hypothetical protein RRG08_028244 [Elysia crispata]|uniref:PiggyBac transposable element-derived protein domain-containing protein n=1 Tax=Elysia crispata TaxID=231223 RepID=A0AAE0YDS6_9GAST|nr:hypothetical protein RRG08_028244 [Elysia crispata]
MRRGAIDKPECIDTYDQYMNGCDRADQQVQYYGMHKRKMYKWWEKNFHFLLELTVIKANIIHNTKRLAVGMKKLELVNFKNMLIQQLTAAACIERQEAPRETQVPVQALDRLAPESHFLESLKKDKLSCVQRTWQQEKDSTCMCNLPWEATPMQRKLLQSLAHQTKY